MFMHVQKLIMRSCRRAGPGRANALQEGLGGQFGEMAR